MFFNLFSSMSLSSFDKCWNKHFLWYILHKQSLADKKWYFSGYTVLTLGVLHCMFFVVPYVALLCWAEFGWGSRNPLQFCVFSSSAFDYVPSKEETFGGLFSISQNDRRMNITINNGSQLRLKHDNGAKNHWTTTFRLSSISFNWHVAIHEWEQI